VVLVVPLSAEGSVVVELVVAGSAGVELQAASRTTAAKRGDFRDMRQEVTGA